MASGSTNIYASAPLRSLLAAEVAALQPQLQHCSGDYGLLIATSDLPAPALPMLACWAELQLVDDLYRGALRARQDESLPFLDESFGLVLLRHALERAVSPMNLLRDAVRVLTPGGLLAITGVHPLSAWAPWLRWHTKAQPISLPMPLLVGEWLRREHMQIDQIQRVGPVLPRAMDTAASTPSLMSGGFTLLAHKRTPAMTPQRLDLRAAGSPRAPALASGARRQPCCASFNQRTTV